MESKVVYDIFHLVYWDWRIALDLFLGGLGVGAFLYALFIYYYKNRQKLMLFKIGSIIAPIAVALGLLAMLSEIGHPFRILNTLIHFNSTSILSWGGVLQQLFLAVSALFVFLILTGRNESLRERIGILAALLAISVGLYHGFLLSFATARPLWNAGASNFISLMSLVNTGVAAVLICASFSEKGQNEIADLSGVTNRVLIISILLQIVAVFIWALSLVTGKADLVKALYTLNGRFGLLFWGGAVLVGLVIPFTLLVTRKDKAFPVFLTSLLILIGGFVFRYVLVLCGQIS